MKEEKKHSREKELETILTLCVFLVILFLITKQQHKYLLTLSVFLGLIGMFWNYMTSKIAWAWLKFSEVLGSVTSKIILSVVFFVFLLPIALLSRVFGKSNLQLKKSDGSSYYFTRNHKYESKDLKAPW